MTTITALPTAPSRSDTANFASRADAWITQFTNTTVAEINTVAGEVNANAATATTQAASAATSATAAASSALLAGATVWVSGTTYAIGDPRYSPINLQTYRRKTAGAGTTDPSADSTNWTLSTDLPSQTGNSGKFLTTDGTSPSWASLPAGVVLFSAFTLGAI